MPESPRTRGSSTRASPPPARRTPRSPPARVTSTPTSPRPRTRRAPGARRVAAVHARRRSGTESAGRLMRELTLVAVPDCPLSEHARQVLDTLAADGLLVWREIATGARRQRAPQRRRPGAAAGAGERVRSDGRARTALRARPAPVPRAGPTGDGLAVHPTTVLDMATPLPVVPAHPAAREQALECELAAAPASKEALGLCREQRAESWDYIDDYRYVVCARGVFGACPDVRRAARRENSPRGIATKEG